MKANTFQTEGELIAELERHIREDSPPVDDLVVMVLRTESEFGAMMMWRTELTQPVPHTTTQKARDELRVALDLIAEAPPGRLPMIVHRRLRFGVPRDIYVRWLPLETPWGEVN